MEIGIPAIIWTILYLAVGLWLAMRIFAILLQYLIRRKSGVLVKIDRVGLGAFHKIVIIINEGLKVEIDKVWLSSCYFNDAIRQPVVLRMGEVRIQAFTYGHKDRQAQTASRNGSTKELGLPKLAVYLQHFGIKIDSLTVMLLKTMVADCLIHMEGQELGLDISYIENSLQFIVNAGSVNCRVLRSVSNEEQPGQSSQPCLAEMSFSLYVDLSVYKNNIKHVKGSRILVDKPQIMLTEGLLSGNYFKEENSLAHNQKDPNEKTDRSKTLQKLPQELGIDVSNVDVKIVRETKQRSLNVKIKTFHVDMFNQYKETDSQEVTCTLLIEDFSTKSEQARFADLVKLELRTMLSDEEIHIKNTTQGAYFHYHHDEFQYWALVISQFAEKRNKNASNVDTKMLNTEQASASSPTTHLERKVTLDVELLDISTAFSTASCPGLVLGVSRVFKHVVVKPGLQFQGKGMLPWLQSHDLVYELEVDTLYCTHTDSQIPLTDFSGKKHFWNHVLYSSILMVKVNKLGQEIRVNGMQDHLHVEWSTSTVGIVISLVTALARAKISAPRKLSNAAFKPVTNMNIPVVADGNSSTFVPLVKFDVTNSNIFVCNNYNVGLMLRIDSVCVEYKQTRVTATVEGSKLQYIDVKEKFQNVIRSVDIERPTASIKEIRIRFKVPEKEITVQLAKELLLDWTTACHMCIIQVLEDVKELKHKLKGEEVGSVQNIPVRKPSKDQNTKLSVNIMVTTSVSLNLRLSSLHSVTFHSDKILMSLSPQEVVMEIDSLGILFDQEKIFHVEILQVKKLFNIKVELPDGVQWVSPAIHLLCPQYYTIGPTISGLLLGTMPKIQLMDERKSFKYLTLETNRAWNISIDVISINFPYNFNFAACFEEFVNFQKWLKLVHKVKKKPFTVDSKLPADLQIKVKVFKLALCDDPFEVKLGDNYELMKDEYNESEKRRNVLHQKVQNLKKTVGIIPAHKLEEVYSTLAKSNSDIYIQRSRQLYQITPLRTKLFTWNMENVGIIALADSSIHGKENVVKSMKEIDPDSPYPEGGLEFTTLWCRYVRFEVESWTFQFRDYPQLALNIVDMNIWGRLLGAEIDGAKRAKRQSKVEVASPWGDMEVERNLPTLKFFHDLSCDVEVLEMAHGACWEPAVAMFNLGLDLINKPSVDPSKPLPWWDKIRLLLHGRLTLTTTKMRWLYHASLDPYNSTELMDWTWTDLVLDWTNAKFILKGDLDVYARTASKYDDCKLLSMPNLKFCAKIQWLCLGDPNDHHHVMPCAPDRVPDYSHDTHDSYRAFRSQNFTLSISLETHSSRHKDNVSSKHPKYPNGLFYASTLRFLDRIKTCLIGSVTRPIKRGLLFNNLKPRKVQLSRHYKYAQLSVNFHQFEISYWMSFALQHGAKFSGKSLVLELKNELELKPVDDGLIHRPRADWKVIHLCTELSDTKIWLCSSQQDMDEELNLSVAGRPITESFFLSVSKVTYQRYSEILDEDLEEIPPSPGTATKTPLHNVQVYEMRGSWNKHNRAVLIGLMDGFMKAQSLKRNLSAEALKGFKVEGGNNHVNRTNPKGSSLMSDSDTMATPSPSTKMQTGHAHSMLMKLVAESDSKSVAFTEEPSSANMDQLQGVAACQKDDILQKKWHVELHNSQITVKGCETQGFVIVAAAKAEILSSSHVPVWVDGQLKDKHSWVGSLECMQYYATVESKPDFTDDNIPWLSRQHVEDRSEPDLTGLQEMAGSGQSVGGIVNTSYGSDKKSRSVQLQRIISRCKCQFFFASYGEVDPEQLQEVPPPPSEDSDMMKKEEGVDTFTLLHHDLNVCSNHLQYAMILDIVNNLLLHVELKKKEATEKLQSMRFQLQLSRVEDQKTPILQLQENVRQQMELSRQYERELFLVIKALEEEGVNFLSDEDNASPETTYTTELIQDRDMLEASLRQCKDKIIALNEELTIRISCFKESQLQTQAQLQQNKQTSQAHVIRRNEVCFKFAQWRLTEMDGQVGIVDLALRNFVYTKVNRDNETWTHLVELGWVKMTNLLPNAIYKDILVPRDPPGQDDNRKMTLRVLCTERPPVGGIAVKEHFEVNVVPLQIQMTYQFFKKMMEFFFPDKNIETDDHDEVMEGASISKPPKSEKKGQQKKEIKRVPSLSTTDDIDKMKERAANNNTFLYIKIPQVSLRVSYKGEKEKNIEDVHDFSLVLPTLEYHNCIWTWFDLLMTMKGDTKRVLIAQALKQKLHLRSRIGEETPLTDVQQEEDKAKMLLGAKLLAPQEKPAKKTLFGKSNK